MFRRTLVGVVAVVAFVATACGSGSSDDRVVSNVDGLAASLSQVESATSYVMTTWNAQEVRVAALGADSNTEIDPDRPSAVVQITPQGTYTRLDMAVVFEPLFGPIGELGFEIWADERLIVIDSNDFERLQEVDPTADFGPFAPAISSIDLDALGAGSPALVAALVGSTPPDLSELATRLPAALDDAALTSDDPTTYEGTASFTSLTEALGGDVDALSKSAAGGAALSLGVDAGDLAEVYLDAYGQMTTEVVIEIGDDSSITLTTVTDLSAVFRLVVESDELELGSASERAAVLAMFDDARWILEQVTRFEPAPDLTLPPAPTPEEDRTAEWRAFLVASGFLDG